MKKVLVVDDNQNNRMILSLLLEDYAEEFPDHAFEIHEAVNGNEAVMMCQENAFDLVFMDIMMPEMDGIEATQRIRLLDKNAMIIAVSAVDDTERKKQILNSGAEDYISKPVNSDIFQSRLGNYLTIIESRNKRQGGQHLLTDGVFNLFSSAVYSRSLNFMIKDEDTLSEFWEYYLLDEKEKYDDLSDVVRSVYALGDLQVKLGNSCRIVVEESAEQLFFTLTDIDKMDIKLIKLTMAKNSNVKNYTMNDTLFTAGLQKICTAEAVQTPVSLPETVTVLAVTPSEYKKSVPQELRVYHFMDPEDLLDLEEFISKLSSLLLIVGSSDVTEDEVVSIASYLEQIGRIMTIYTETYNIGQAMQMLSGDIETHIEMFRAQSSALGPMCKAFNNDIATWLRMTFHDGSPSLNFLDDTIIANSQTISAMLKMNDDAGDAGDLDDIFDF